MSKSARTQSPVATRVVMGRIALFVRIERDYVLNGQIVTVTRQYKRPSTASRRRVLRLLGDAAAAESDLTHIRFDVGGS